MQVEIVGVIPVSTIKRSCGSSARLQGEITSLRQDKLLTSYLRALSDVRALFFGSCMFEIKVDVNIPLVFQNVEGKTMFEAAENVRTLIEDGLSVICATNQEQIKKQMTISVRDIRGV